MLSQNPSDQFIFRRFWQFIFSTLAIATLTLTAACGPTVGNLQSYNGGTYEFLYPNGWQEVTVDNGSPGVDVVFRDLIERSENISVVISNVEPGKSLADLGDPTAIGYRFMKQTNATEGNGIEAELLRADSLERDGKTYYLLEYDVQTPNQGPRHNLASVAINGDRLYTFNISTSQRRWQKMAPTFEVAARSFNLY